MSEENTPCPVCSEDRPEVDENLCATSGIDSELRKRIVNKEVEETIEYDEDDDDSLENDCKTVSAFILLFILLCCILAIIFIIV